MKSYRRMKEMRSSLLFGVLKVRRQTSLWNCAGELSNVGDSFVPYAHIPYLIQGSLPLVFSLKRFIRIRRIAPF